MSDLVIQEIGGQVHYSPELRTYLASLPREEAEWVVTHIEHKYRYRRVVVGTEALVEIARELHNDSTD